MTLFITSPRANADALQFIESYLLPDETTESLVDTVLAETKKGRRPRLFQIG